MFLNLLLKLKHVKWVLDSAKLAQGTSNHKLAILRSRFLFVINGLHSFIVDHIEASHAKFMKDVAEMNSSCNLDIFMASLTHYLTRIRRLCLLEECTSQQIMSQALSGLFELCLKVKLPKVSVEHLASEFSTRVAFLWSVVSEATQDKGRRQNSIPILQILESAHHCNTDMQTRLHFNR